MSSQGLWPAKMAGIALADIRIFIDMSSHGRIPVAEAHYE